MGEGMRLVGQFLLMSVGAGAAAQPAVVERENTQTAATAGEQTTLPATTAGEDTVPVTTAADEDNTLPAGLEALGKWVHSVFVRGHNC